MVIAVEQLSFRYAGSAELTLHELGFEIAPGEIFGFLGPSGAGKSTTQNILTKLLAGVTALNLPKLMLVALAAAPLAPQIALFLGAFAANKVQGFALQKALSVLVIIPMLGWLLPMPWLLIAMCLPTFWPGALLLELQQTGMINWGLYVCGLIFQIALTWLLLRRMIAKMQR